MEKENLRRREEAARTAVTTVVAPSTKTSNVVRDQLESESAEALGNDKTPIHSAHIMPMASSLDVARGVAEAESQLSDEAQRDVPRPSIEVYQSTS